MELTLKAKKSTTLYVAIVAYISGIIVDTQHKNRPIVGTCTMADPYMYV